MLERAEGRTDQNNKRKWVGEGHSQPREDRGWKLVRR